jgi:lipoprotein signal peptidase
MRDLTRKSLILRTTTIGLAVLVADAGTKVLAAFLASRGFGRGVLLPVQNPDFSLGLASAPFPIMLALASLGILGFGGYTAWQAHRRKALPWVPGLLIGGATANLLDRLLFGAVHDWLYLPKVVINLADVAVVVGLTGYFVSLVMKRQAGPHQGR